MRSPNEAEAGRQLTAADSLADLVLSTLGPETDQQRARPSTLPVARLVSPLQRSTAYYVVSAIDVWGRIADRSALRMLHWRAGLRISVSVVQAAAVIVPRHDARESITRQGHLRLPAPVRHMLRVQPGDRFLMLACPDRDILVAFTTPAVDAMIINHYGRHVGEAAP